MSNNKQFITDELQKFILDKSSSKVLTDFTDVLEYISSDGKDIKETFLENMDTFFKKYTNGETLKDLLAEIQKDSFQDIIYEYCNVMVDIMSDKMEKSLPIIVSWVVKEESDYWNEHWKHSIEHTIHTIEEAQYNVYANYLQYSVSTFIKYCKKVIK